MSTIHDANGRGIDTLNPLAVRAESSGIMQPVDIQARYAQTIQTHNAVSVPATTGTSQSAYIDTNGFSDVALTFTNDASTASYADVHWSHDGVAYHSAEGNILPANTQIKKAIQFPTKARYMKVVLANTDAAAHVMSAWAYLKA